MIRYKNRERNLKRVIGNKISNMNQSITKEIRTLSLGFLFIFLGFNGVQQYVTTFLSEEQTAALGFQSLILIYLFFVLSDPLSAVCVLKYGARKCMIVSSIFYSLFVISLLTKSHFLIYFTSAFLGIAASFLWTGQSSYLIRASDARFYGANSGFFSSLQSLGSAFGVITLGFLVSRFSFKVPFLLFSIFPIIGLLLLFGLEDLRVERKMNHLQLIKKSVASKTALRLSSLWFSAFFVYGLIIGILPMEIKKVLGVSYIGILSALFYIVPIILSYFLGKLSDIKGRKIMIVLSYIIIMAGLFSLIFFNRAFFLVLAIFLFALDGAIIRPVTSAFVGDLATENNLEFLTALFWMVQIIGTVSALTLSSIFKLEVKTLYLISAFVITISLFVLLPLLRMKTEKIREKISQEIC
jgi:MFS family permease